MQYTQKEIQEKQLEALQAVCKSFEDEAETPKEKISLLREFLQVKETAAKNLATFMAIDVMNLIKCGASAVSVLNIANTAKQELSTNLAQMEIFADRLAIALHLPDIREAYGNISERAQIEADKILNELTRKVNEALNDNERLQEMESQDVWENFSREYKNKIH